MNNRHKSSWNQYNKNLINCGGINFWISKDSIKKWKAKKNKKHFGRPHFYSNEAILTALTIRFVYRLPLRAMESFLNSLFDILYYIEKIRKLGWEPKIILKEGLQMGLR